MSWELSAFGPQSSSQGKSRAVLPHSTDCVTQLRLAGACTAEAANACLDQEFLPDWQQRFTVAPANSTDAHRPFSDLHDIEVSLSHTAS